MKRRNFLKLCCAAVVAPLLPIEQSPQIALGIPSAYHRQTCLQLRRLIEQRRNAARQALIDDLEEHFFDADNMPTWLNNDDNYSTWEWVRSSVTLNYKKQ